MHSPLPTSAKWLEQFNAFKLRLLLEKRVIDESGVFDHEFYLGQLDRPIAQGHDLVIHYLLEGSTRGLDPHPLFQTSYYLDNYPDVAVLGANPLVHYLKHGGFERRNPCPSFDSHLYLQNNEDVRNARCNPLAHYIKTGVFEKRASSADPEVAANTASMVSGARLKVRGTMLYPPGHFYSPIVDQRQLVEYLERQNVFCTPPAELAGIDLRSTDQLHLLDRLVVHGKKIFFPNEKSPEFRYFFDNKFFSSGDASVLFGMLMEFRPHQVIEVGSGFSSAAMLDVNERMLSEKIHFTFIEPHSERLLELIRPQDSDKATIVEKNVQTCSVDLFSRLEENDFLFIDSSHVSKAGSDLNFLLFQVLPVLKPGVIVHFHDIFYPFEYPASWLKDGRNWNENYLLRAFLTNNNCFEILLFNHYLHKFHEQKLLAFSTHCDRSLGSLWLRKSS